MESFPARSRTWLTSTVAVCVLVSVGKTTIARAADEAIALEEVVITAQKRGAESLQKVPLTVQALSAADIERAGLNGFQDFAGRIPGLSAYDAGGNQKKIKLRGVSSASESETSETVAVYWDDVPVTNSGGTNNENGASPDIEMFDMDRVEVLKGPQGTLYGASSMGGTVRFISKLPDATRFAAETGGKVSTTRNGDVSYGLTGMLNLPIVDDRLAVRFVATYDDEGGFMDNMAPLTGLGYGPAGKKPGQKDENENKHWMLRATAQWQTTDDLLLRLRYYHRDYDARGENSAQASLHGAGDGLDQINYVVPTNRDKLDILNLALEYNLGWATLFSSSSYFDRKIVDVQDTTFFTNIIFGTTDPSGALRNVNDVQEFVQEIRLASSGEQRLEWVAGLYYSDLDKVFTQDGPVPGMNEYLGADVVPVLPGHYGDTENVFQSDVPQSIKQKAVFGEATLHLGEQWAVTVGGRYFKVEQDFSYRSRGLFSDPLANSRDASPSESGFNPKASVSFQVNDDVLLYATAAKGYRIGGVNQPVPPTPQCGPELDQLGLENSPPSFDSDELWNYELAAKTQFLDNRLRVNGGVYRIDWKDIQLRRQLACGFTFFLNGGEAEVNGVELQVEALLTENFDVYANFGYNDAKLKGSVPFLGATADSKLPGVPEITASAGAEVRFPVRALAGFARADVTYVDEFNYLFEGQLPPFSSVNPTAGNYSLTNIRTGVRGDTWNASLFVNNLFDRRADVGIQSTLFADIVFRNRPREIGLAFSKEF